MAERFLVYKVGDFGLGHVLTSILNCAHYCYTRGYSLAIDFRGFSYLREDRHDRALSNFAFLFPRDLSLVTDLARVDELCGRIDRVDYSNITRSQFVHGVDAEIIVLNGDLVDYIYSPEMKQAGNYRIALKGELLSRMSEKLKQTGWVGKTVGIYFRHGNGEYLDLRFDMNIFPNHQLFYRELKESYVTRAKEIAKKLDGERVRFFVASDSAEFVASIKEALPNAFSIAELVSDQIWGRVLGKGSTDMVGLSDAINDLFFLSFCDHLLFSPSLFPQFAVLNSVKIDANSFEVMRMPTLADLVARSEPDEAVTYMRTVVRKMFSYNKEDHVPEACLHLGRALERAGRPEAGGFALRRRDYLFRALHDADYRSAYRALKLNRVMDSSLVQQVGRAVERANENPFFLALEAECLERSGDLTAAALMWQRVLTIDPEFPGAHIALSRILSRQGRPTEAVAIVEAALTLDPDDPYAQYLHQDVLWLSGRKFVNVAVGCDAEQSSLSRWSRPNDALGAVKGKPSGSYAFHTDFEDSPWWMLDLGRTEAILAVRVFNRDDGYSLEVVESLTIALSETRTGPWQSVYEGGAVFGGLRTGKPLFVQLQTDVAARFVKLQLHKHAALHLDEVEVFSAAYK